MKKTIELNRKTITAMLTKDHSEKMSDMWSLSTSCRCNGNCQLYKDLPGCVCGKCFSEATLNQWSSLAAKLERNTDILCNTIIDYDLIPVITKKDIFRFEAFGDLINTTQFYNYYQFCIKNPGVMFALWTKNPWIIAAAFKKYEIKKPKNMIIVYSQKYLNENCVDPCELNRDIMSKYSFIDKTFTVYTLDWLLAVGIDPDTFINCGARSCNGCRKCYKKRTAKNIRELEKSDMKRWQRMKKQFTKTAIMKKAINELNH